MGTFELITLFFQFAGGFGLFIYGMHIMAEELQKTAGNKMKELLEALTNNRFLGVAVGAIITAIIQSSSACTVMIIGFVNAGLMNLTQAAGVIMGANIGTTITSWIVSSEDWLKFFKPSVIAPFAVAVGVIMMFFTKSEKKKEIGGIIAGFGMLFIGLDMMSDTVKPFRDSPAFKTLFTELGKSPLLGILAGAVVTAIIQSSSASVGILQTLAMQGLVPFNAAVYIILGQNIGTCVTALLSSIGAKKTAKRAAMIHLLFNVIGSTLFAIVAIVLFKVIKVPFGAGAINIVQISIVHTLFNIGNTVILFPFAGTLVKLSGRLISGEDEVEENKLIQLHLDDRMLETPSFAVESMIEEVVNMGEICDKNIKLCYEALLNKDQKKLDRVFKNEKVINDLEKMLTKYLVKISAIPLTEQQNKITTGLFHTINDIERVGDHAENIAELIQTYITENLDFSKTAYDEMKKIFDLIIETFEAALDARKVYDKNKIDIVIQNEEIVDDLEELLRDKHIYRLSQNICDAEIGVIFLDLISNLERISDHSLNIVQGVAGQI